MVYRDLLEDENALNKILVSLHGVPLEKFPENLIVTPFPFERIFSKNYLEVLKERNITYEFLEQKFIYHKNIQPNLLIENKVLVTYIGMGIVNIFDILYPVLHVKNLKRIIFVGSAGALDDQTKAGDLNFPIYIIPFENLSAFFVDLSKEFPILDKEIQERLIKVSEQIKEEFGYNINIWSNLHVTVPTVHSLETRDFLEYLKSIGVSTIDMELSAFASLCRKFKKKAGAILRISDKPLHNVNFYKDNYKDLDVIKEKAREVTFKTILRYFKII